MAAPTENPAYGSNTNLYALFFAFLTFMSFSVLQLFYSIKANSEAMLGDSLTMILDAITYGGNGLAEWSKGKQHKRAEDECDTGQNAANKSPTANGGKTEDVSSSSSSSSSSSHRSKTLLYLECIGPSFSVMTLIGVTVYIFVSAFKTIREFHSGVLVEDDTNVEIMLLFSSINLIIDIVNIYQFVRSKKNSSNDAVEVDFDAVGASSGDGGNDDANGHDEHSKTSESNMNMCSAYTHVFADTLRSIAVLVAALIAEISGANGSYCDAVAAIIVSLIVGVSAVPLIHGLWKLWFSRGDCSSEEDQVNLLGSEDGGDGGLEMTDFEIGSLENEMKTEGI